MANQANQGQSDTQRSNDQTQNPNRESDLGTGQDKSKPGVSDTTKQNPNDKR